MSEKPKDHPAVIRRRHNVELLRRMRAGEALWSFDSTASWFPPRPVISKDPGAIARLYGARGESRQDAMHKASEDVENAPATHLRLADENRPR